jgi:phosphatidylglycerophosphatase A
MFIPGPEELAIIRKLDLKQPSTWVATWGGLGFLTPGPGTWGTLGAIPFAYIAYSVGGIIGVLVMLAVIIYYGLWATERFETRTETHDCKMIVVDEVAGMLIAFLPTGGSPFLVFLAFALFRAFDIFKPGPIGTIDKKMPGARGVMADDILAGLAAAVIVGGLRLAGLG